MLAESDSHPPVAGGLYVSALTGEGGGKVKEAFFVRRVGAEAREDGPRIPRIAIIASFSMRVDGCAVPGRPSFSSYAPVIVTMGCN